MKTLKKRASAFALAFTIAAVLFPTTALAGDFKGPTALTVYIGVEAPDVVEFIFRHEPSYPDTSWYPVFVSGTLPTGMRYLDVFNNKQMYRVTGTPAADTVGTYTITATTTNGTGSNGNSITCTLAVEKGPHTIVASDATIPLGQSYTLPVHSINGNGDTIPAGSVDAPSYTFSSGSAGVATIDGTTGVITPVAKGTTTITINSAATNSYDPATNNGMTVTITVGSADPTVSLVGTAPSGTAGAVGNKTITVTVADSYSENIDFICDINNIQKTASRSGNGTVSFIFTAGELDVLAAGSYNITVSSAATTNNNAIAGTVVGTLTVNTPAPPPSGGGWYVPPTTQKPPAQTPTPFPTQGTVTGKRITAYTQNTLRGKTAFRLNKNEQFTLLELAENGKALLIQKGELKGYIAIKDIKATFGAQLRGTATAKKASVYTVQANGKLKRIGYYPKDTLIGINGVDGGYLISNQPSVTYYLKTGEWRLAKQ